MDVTVFRAYCLLFVLLNYGLVGSVALSFKLLDGNEIPAVALGTSLGHLADLWIDSFEKKDVPEALRRSLGELQLDYVDLYLMHYPFAYNKDGSVSLTDYLTTWKGMEDVKDLNLTRSIGVSNFNSTQMKRLWDHSRIKPTVLQIEVNPTITQIELVNWCHEKGIVVMGYTPFGAVLGRQADAPPPRVKDPLLQALAAKYRRSVPQILLRYLINRSVIPIVRSMNKERIEQNINIFDFRLTDEDVQRMSRFDRNYRLRTNTYVKYYRHPNFPFEKKNVTDAEIQHAIDSIVEN